MPSVKVAMFGFVLAFATGFAGVESAAAEEPPVSRSASIEIRATSSDEIEKIITEDIRINTNMAVAQYSQIALPVNEHFSQMEILEAATVKADGHRIEVPKDRILVSTLPNSAVLSVFQADVKVRTIVYSDVLAGDTVHYRVRIRDRSRLRGISYNFIAASNSMFDHVKITLDAPKSVSIRDSSAGFTRTSEPVGERQRITWSLDGAPYQAAEPNAVAPIDRDPFVFLSSYPDWRTVGQSFLNGMAPQSEPTPEVRALAESLTQGITDRREQARAIRDWVAKNVRYFGIFLNNGGFVAHDARSVLASRYGDCKDHAALTRALLAAKGIESIYVLVNASPTYREPSVPTPMWFNHVILWLPEFGLYVDPTARYASFENLPDTLADKAVLIADGKSDAPQRIPPLNAASSKLSFNIDATLSQDGTVNGVSTISASGPIAWRLREAAAQAQNAGGDAYATKLLNNYGWAGSGTVLPSDPTDYREPYILKTTFALNNKFTVERDDNNRILPYGPILVKPIRFAIYDFMGKNRNQNFVCRAETEDQAIDFNLPETWELTNMPKDQSISGGLASYQSQYELQQHTLHVTRHFVLRAPSETCTAAMVREMRPVLVASAKDFEWRPHFSENNEAEPMANRPPAGDVEPDASQKPNAPAPN